MTRLYRFALRLQQKGNTMSENTTKVIVHFPVDGEMKLVDYPNGGDYLTDPDGSLRVRDADKATIAMYAPGTWHHVEVK